jgi:hypothetical protein
MHKKHIWLPREAQVPQPDRLIAATSVASKPPDASSAAPRLWAGGASARQLHTFLWDHALITSIDLIESTRGTEGGC